ncbi:ImpB/MucB/SamB family [Synechococcus sp. PCC 7335]|uniref:DNA polymerase IV n=1 Tax=Synechococcus sp. (strain ATCC 29403 / PCC 7335) TaxID=91464 RepID=UPI00017ED8E4|nr:DNA polymerase IV [Synechococcus sp. PCC 7335]EDX84921.1 ImpB/MucB/SamB family [Synechococcus sp. PCC 7335]
MFRPEQTPSPAAGELRANQVRKIIHIDMDAFYASIEQRDNPELRGKPVAVGGLPSQRGAVCAASYEARKYGIHSAMPSRSAITRCQHLIFVKPRFEHYRAVSAEIRAIFFDYTELVEPLSLDEAYLDVSVDKQGIGSAVAIAKQIRDRIRTDLQLTASAGVSINKFLAKIASDLNKPDGLSFISPEEAKTFIEQLRIEDFYGVGPATATKMKSLGIHTGADLKTWTQAELTQTFGKVGSYYYRVARAEDNRPVNPNRIRKSIGAERSFFRDLSQIEDMETALANIATEVSQRLQKNKRQGHTLTLKIKYDNYDTITRSRTLETPIEEKQILQIATRLLSLHVERDRPVRLLGITVSNLIAPQPYHQLTLNI